MHTVINHHLEIATGVPRRKGCALQVVGGLCWGRMGPGAWSLGPLSPSPISPLPSLLSRLPSPISPLPSLLSRLSSPGPSLLVCGFSRVQTCCSTSCPAATFLSQRHGELQLVIVCFISPLPQRGREGASERERESGASPPVPQCSTFGGILCKGNGEHS